MSQSLGSSLLILLLFAQGGGKVPVPDREAQRTAEKLVRDVFKSEYSKTGPADRMALAAKLLQQAGETKDDAAARYVLLKEARDLAAQAGDVDAALAASTAIARHFEVDAVAAKASALDGAVPNIRTPEGQQKAAGAWLALADEAASGANWEAAQKAASAAASLARRSKDLGLIRKAENKAKEVGEIKTIVEASRKALESLAATPDDPEAHLALGEHFCWVASDWPAGLAHLARGSDPILKELALKELSRPASPSDQVAVADGWFDLAEKEKSFFRKDRMYAHARLLYEAALDKAAGLTRAKIEKRLADLEAKSVARAVDLAATVDLLALVDPKKDAYAGTWERVGTQIVAVSGGFTRLDVPFEPPDEYDVKALIESGPNTEAVLLLTRKGKAFAFSMYPGQSRGAIYSSLADARFAGVSIPTDKPFTVVVQVRADSVKAFVDERPCLEWKPDAASVGPHTAWRPRNANILGLGTNGARITFVSLRLSEVTGRGKKLR